MITIAFLVLLLIVFPCAVYAQNKPGHARKDTRTALYLKVSSSLAILLGLCVLVVHFERKPLAGLGFAIALPPLALWGWTVALVAGGVLIVFLLKWAERAFHQLPDDNARMLIPQTVQERLLCAFLVAPMAGLAEEVLFRGYAITRLTHYVGNEWVAAFLALAPFALAHLYQGWLGMVRSATIGFLLTLPFVLTGALLPSIFAHFLIDFLLLLVLARRLYPD